MLLGEGDGTFGPAATIPAGGSAWYVVTGDFDSNDVPDLVVSNSQSNTVTLLLGFGDETFAPPVSFVAGSSPRYLAAADFDGDGDDDVAVGAGAYLSVLKGNGSGGFGAAHQYPSGSLGDLAVGDFTGDGILISHRSEATTAARSGWSCSPATAPGASSPALRLCRRSFGGGSRGRRPRRRRSARRRCGRLRESVGFAAVRHGRRRVQRGTEHRVRHAGPDSDRGGLRRRRHSRFRRRRLLRSRGPARRRRRRILYLLRALPRIPDHRPGVRRFHAGRNSRSHRHVQVLPKSSSSRAAATARSRRRSRSRTATPI